MRRAVLLLSLGMLARADSGVERRLAEIKAIVEKGRPDAEAALLKALKDRDWEVVYEAAAALGTRGSPEAVGALVDVALNHPVRRIRRAAAGSLKQLAPDEAARRIDKRLRGRTALAAADAMEVIAHPLAAKSLRALLKNKDGAVRAAAVAALGALASAEHIEDLAKLLKKDEDVRVRAAIVVALVRTRDPAAASPLREGLKDRNMTAVMARRHIWGLKDLLAAIPDKKKSGFAATMCLRSFGMAGHPEGDARFARLLGHLGDKQGPVGPVDEYRKTLMETGLSHPAPEVRAASAAALARIGSVAAYEKVADVAKHDAEERVRFHALRAAVKIKGDEAAALVIDRVQYDRSPVVREEAAAICGRRRLGTAVKPLVDRLTDKSWEVCVSAAVSLGKLRDARGLSGLIQLYKHKDWRRRGGAVAGLGWIKQKGAIKALIAALRDKEPAVMATAVEFLRHISGERFGYKQKPWRTWWAQWEDRFEFRDREAEAKLAKKYGYATEPRKIYEGLDIIVLQTRKGGDNIQFLLDDFEIEHRIVRAASVSKCGLHPHALFVANCPGEITKKDVERLQWYVRAGGYMFASCWALTHTVEACFPGVVRKLKTRAQVLDVVIAEPVPSTSPLIAGVFDGVTRPHYMLEGSHLIELIDPERFEVLIDSPECATRWGDGNLAGWFTIGHGLILDSANHFDLQGMVRAKLKDETERKAFAINHLGYDFGQLRELEAEGVFRKQPLAIKRTRDLSIFRFITTFVRQKRLADDR